MKIRFAVLVLVLSFLALPAYALDYPHTTVNNISCNSCHFVYGAEASLLVEGLNYGQNIDDTQYNALCWSCHNDIEAPYMRTHSSLQIDNGYGDWSIECRTCHNPHTQRQIKSYGSDTYLTTGSSTNITATSLTKDGAGWTVDEFEGLVLIPNVSLKKYGYKITGNSADTVTVDGPIDQSRVSLGNTFAVIYGKLIHSTVELDEIIGVSKTGDKTARFFNETGTNSFADGDSTYDGICEVCHTLTNHFRNDGNGSDQLHTNVGTPAGTNCMGCHSHSGGFAHGGGSGVGCEECHGHDPGYGGATGGVGSFETHSTHTENDSDDLRGPNVDCDTCHNTSSFPNFTDGVSYNEYKTGTPTTVCNTCHSPGGTYNGVSDAEVGAQNNWADGVYETDGTLKSGKEKWCATCHDESPSVINVTAPNIVGDEEGATSYGTGYGFYKTGHGLPSAEIYPWTEKSGSPLQRRGAGAGCGSCHDLTSSHIDGLSRTYAQPGTSESYRTGYRLKKISNDAPLEIPRSNLCPWEEGYSEQLPVVSEDFRLCFSCHDSGPFTNTGSDMTNFRNDSSGVNSHYYHLSEYQNCGPGPMWSSDWSVGNDSRITCVSCHNVHGSKRLSMVRDGELISKEPGLEVAYYNDTVSYQCGGPGSHDPTPANVTLPDSTGTVWNGNVGNLCQACHGSCGFDMLYMRTTFQHPTPYITGVFGDAGNNIIAIHFSEGVYSNNDATGDLVPTDLTLLDSDNGRTITAVTHTAGQSTAQLTLSTALDSSADIGTDAVFAATIASVFSLTGDAMDTIGVTIVGDSALPSISDRAPSDSMTGVAIDANITFTLSDSGSGIDWTTFSIQLSGDKGYSKTYTELDTSSISKTGSIGAFDITVDPDTDFANEEVITVTVNVNDMIDNSMTPSIWSFTTAFASAPETVTLHPSGLASNPGGYWTVPTANQWDTYLDSNDGNSTYVTSNTGSQGAILYIDMDNPVGLDTATIQSITFHVYARYVSGWSPSPPAVAGNLDIGYMTGTSTVWKGSTSIDSSGNYNLVSSVTYTNDSDGGALDLADINSLQISIKRLTSGGYPLRITEMYAEIVYMQ